MTPLDAPTNNDPASPLVSEEERGVSLASMLRHWNGQDAVWVFAYGSLIWNPELDFDDKHCGMVHGYHRSLCLWSRLYRGTPQAPGLVLALDHGGSCQGVAYRVPGPIARRELTRLWQREMVTGAYQPRWLKVRPCGPCARSSKPHANVTALGFTIRRDRPAYAGKLDEATLLDTLRHARGLRGTSADYLMSTVASLTAHGLEDLRLARLAEKLAASLPKDQAAS